MTVVDQPSAVARATTWLTVLVAAVLLVLGVSWYGWSLEIHHRFWDDIFDRMHGPMSLRFFMQPTMALLAALPDGIKDARLGHSAFFWTVWRDPKQHGGRLRQGVIAIARTMLIGMSIDIIYQHKVFETFYPVEALVIAILLAVIPYFVCRWIIESVARWWFARGSGSRT